MCRTVILSVLFVATAAAQTSRTTFEVASIRRLDQRVPSIQSRSAGGVFARTNVTLAALVQFAYDVLDVELVGGPDWIRRDRFEIEARAASPLSREEMRPLVQLLLEDRFKLVARREQREMRRSEIVLARQDGRMGPALKPCSDPNAEAAPPRVPRDAMVLTGRCQTMAGIAKSIALFSQLLVVDKTGLTGTWDFELMFANPRVPLSAAADPSAPTVPALATALQDQLGLKLQSREGPVDVLVIDSVQQPSEN